MFLSSFLREVEGFGMKLLQHLWVAPAALTVLIAPLSAQAADLNIDSVSDYSATLDLEQAKQLLQQVTSVNQFNDVYPTDWAYQALVRLVKSYGCVAGYPNGSFRGYVPITRYEAAALLASCLDRVTEMTEEVEKLLKEFESELNFVAGSIMLLEDRVGTLEANQFSTTTKLRGKTTFTTGATKAYGTRNGSNYYWDYDQKHKIAVIDGRESPLGSTQNSRSWQMTRKAWRAVHNEDGSLKEKDGKRGTEIIKGTDLEKHYKDIRSRKYRDNKEWKKDGRGGGSRAYNSQYGAFTFNYEQQLNLKTSFTGKDLLYTRLLAGNFCDNAFAGDGVSLAKLSTSACTDDVLALSRLYYRFPYKNDELIDHSLIFVVGPKARNTESLGLWPSAYNRGGARILDWTGLAGVPSVYNKATGAMVGLIYKQKAENKGDPIFSLSMNYVAENGDESDSTFGGIFTNNSAGNFLVQAGYGGEEYGVAFAYRYGQCGTGQRVATNFMSNASFNNECLSDVWRWDIEELYQGDYVAEDAERNSHNFAINGYWVPQETGWVPSVSVGYSYASMTGKGFFKYSPVATQSMFVGLKWDDVFDVGNDLGLAFGMPNFATELAGGYTPHDSNYLVELYASFQVTDNIQITPSVFWLSRPLGHYTANLYGDQDQSRDSSLGVFGGLIQSVFRF